MPEGYVTLRKFAAYLFTGCVLCLDKNVSLSLCILGIKKKPWSRQSAEEE